MGSFIRKAVLWSGGTLAVLLIVGSVFCFWKAEGVAESDTLETQKENVLVEESSGEVVSMEDTQEAGVLTEVVRTEEIVTEKLSEGTEEAENTKSISLSLEAESSQVTEYPEATEKPKQTEPPRQTEPPKITVQPDSTEVIVTPKPTVIPQISEMTKEPTPVEVPREEEHICHGAVSVEEPSCLSAGKEILYCTECKKIISESVIAPLGHDMKMAVWESATCQKAGFYNNICERCGLTESVTVAALSHMVEDMLIQEGNCMEDTVVRHVCKTCGEQVKPDTRYTPQIHQWAEIEVDEEMILYCEWCGITK